MACESSVLINILHNNPDWEERQRAARYLGMDKSGLAEEALLTAIDDEDDDVSYTAILSLVKLKSSRLVNIVIKPKILLSGNESIRWAAGYALGLLGNTVHIKYLCELVNDPDWYVRNEVLSALETLMSKVGEGSPGEDRLMENILLLILMLRVNNDKLQKQIIKTLVKLKSHSYKLLIESLCASDENIKIGVIKTLGEIRNINSVTDLIKHVNDDSAGIRKAAVKALGEIGGAAAINAIIGRFNDGNREVAEAAVNSIISLKNDNTMALILIENLRKTYDTTAKRNIFYCMGEIRHPLMIKPILNNLGSSYFFIRSAAANALVKFGESIRDDLVRVMNRCNISIEPFLKVITDSDNVMNRIRAINALGQLELTEAIEIIEGLTQDDEYEIAAAAEKTLTRLMEANWARANGAFVLGELGGIQSVPILLEILKDCNLEVRFATVSALCKLKEQSTVDIIAKVAVNDPSDDVRARAVRTLGDIGHFDGNIKNVLMKAAGDESHIVRSEAVKVLGKISEDDVIDILFDSLKDKVYKVRKYSLNALYNIGEAIIPKLLKTLRTTADKPVILGVLCLLALLNIQESIPDMEKLLKTQNDQDITNMAKEVFQLLKSEGSGKGPTYLLDD